MGGQYTSHVGVFLYLHDGDRVLLALRRNTGYADEQWNLPSGKLEAGEHVLDAVLREAREEIGIDLDPAMVELAGVVHHRTPRQDGRIGLVFRAALPENTVDYTAACVKLIRQQLPLYLNSWQTGTLEH